jgi:betaine-homocysteine S-methyltransferase
MRGIRERLDQGVVVGAEGYLFELERRGYLKGGPFVPEVVLDFPDAVRELHREFLRAGAEVMVAFTYYAHRDKLRTIGREADLEPLNRQALRLAREVAAEGDALVAGNICNTWVYDPDAPDSSGETVREMYREQVGWAVDEGADLIISETHDYLGEALISLEAIQEAGLPSVVTFASTDAVTIDGFEYVEACRQLEAKGADVVGLNCSRGPETMLPLLEQIRGAVDCHVAAQPVPYRTTPAQPNFEALKDAAGVRGFPLALEPFLCNRFELADFAAAASDLGVNYIGLCCGGAPHYIRSMAERLGRTVPASRYSPDMALHPILGENVGEQAKKFVNWKD